MLPYRPVTPMSPLKLICGRKRLVSVILILFRAGARARVHLFQFVQRKGRLLGILPAKIIVKIRKIGFSFMKLGNYKPHLVSPIAQMHVPYRVMTHKSYDSLHALTYHCGAQMPDMQRFCHIRASVVDDNGLFLRGRLCPELYAFGHFKKIRRQKLRRHSHIYKTRCGGGDVSYALTVF